MQRDKSLRRNRLHPVVHLNHQGVQRGPATALRGGGVQVNPNSSLHKVFWDQQHRRTGGDVNLDRVLSPLPRLGQRKWMMVPVQQPTLPPKPGLISIQHNHRWGGKLHSDFVVCEGLCGVKVEDEYTISSLEDDDFVTLVGQGAVLLLGGEPSKALLCVHEGLIKELQPVVLQGFVVGQVPPAPTVLVAPPITLPREVHPLRMPKLIPQKSQISLPTKATGHQPNHLVQRHPPINNQGIRVYNATHVEVHLLVHQPHCDSFVSDNGLIVGLGVGNALLPPPAVLQGVGEVAHVPLVVALLLEHLDPQVGQRH
mmetsp:Transcript_26714/g.58919  ORF Transcript_26714/g.58919 Transcript_26714/m.58919 type:complete len:312 (-) Transcript_26714:1042-1977(-)